VVEIKTLAEVEAMRGAGRVVAEILAAVQDQAKAGMRTAELDEVARDVLARNGAYSPFLNYQPGFAPVPFPAAICTSVNDAALHGIPGRYKLADGDLLSVDCGAVLDGSSCMARPRPQARPRPGHRHRAVVPGRRQGHVPDRPGRLDDPQRRRQPGGARRAHGGRHRGRPAGPHGPLVPNDPGACPSAAPRPT